MAASLLHLAVQADALLRAQWSVCDAGEVVDQAPLKVLDCQVVHNWPWSSSPNGGGDASQMRGDTGILNVWGPSAPQ